MTGFAAGGTSGAVAGLLLVCWASGSLLLFGWGRRLLQSLLRKRRRLRSAYAFGSVRPGRRWTDWKPAAHLIREMEVADLKLAPELIVVLMLLLAAAGLIGSDVAIQWMERHFALSGQAAFGSHIWLLSLTIGVLLGSLPYFFIRFRVQRKRHKIALRMIMLVQNLIGHYRPNFTIAEMIMKASDTMPAEVRSEWRRLELTLHMQPAEPALLSFAERIQNEWADDVADLLLIGAQYGTDMTESLHDLVSKMQTAKRHEENRLAMITVYRIGTSFMAGFAFFVVGFNIYADAANYRHYFSDPVGRMLLVLSFAVMFVSMALVIRSGRKAF